MTAGEKYCSGAEMVGADFCSRERICLMAVQHAGCGYVFPEWLKRFQHRCELEVRTLLRRHPDVFIRAVLGAARVAVHHFDTSETADGRRGRFSQRSLCRHHRFQKWQCHGCSHAAKHRPPGDMPFHDEHWLLSFIAVFHYSWTFEITVLSPRPKQRPRNDRYSWRHPAQSNEPWACRGSLKRGRLRIPKAVPRNCR